MKHRRKVLPHFPLFQFDVINFRRQEDERMKNVVPYVVMVTGLTAIFVWSKWRQAENREVRAVSVVTPAPAADGIMLIDVRTPEEFHARHRDGAVNIPVDEVETLAPQLVPDKDTLLLLYCRTGKRADRALEILKKMGYNRVENLHRLDM